MPKDEFDDLLEGGDDVDPHPGPGEEITPERLQALAADKQPLAPPTIRVEPWRCAECGKNEFSQARSDPARCVGCISKQGKLADRK